MMYQQIECETDVDADTTPARRTRLVVWVEAQRVGRGDCVTFKETGDILWRVIWVFDTLVSGVNRGWGLDLPKSQRTER